MKNKRQKRRTARTKNIQKEVRDLTLKAISERNISLDQLSVLSSAILDSATSAIKNALPSARKSVLRQVLNGIDDAWAATAKASASGLRHAKRNGLRFAQRDLTQLSKKLSSLEQEFNTTMDRHARRLGGEIGRELRSISGQIKQAGTQIRPAVKAAQKVVMQHPIALTREVASAGTKAVRQALSEALLTTSGFLEGAGKAASSKGARKSKSR